jgi:hypothetical protein
MDCLVVAGAVPQGDRGRVPPLRVPQSVTSIEQILGEIILSYRVDTAPPVSVFPTVGLGRSRACR